MHTRRDVIKIWTSLSFDNILVKATLSWCWLWWHLVVEWDLRKDPSKKLLRIEKGDLERSHIIHVLKNKKKNSLVGSLVVRGPLRSMGHAYSIVGGTHPLFLWGTFHPFVSDVGGIGTCTMVWWQACIMVLALSTWNLSTKSAVHPNRLDGRQLASQGHMKNTIGINVALQTHFTTKNHV